MNIIILTEEDKLSDDLYELADKRATHIRSVLKSEAGDTVEIGLLNQSIGNATIESVADSVVRLSVNQTNPPPNYQPIVDIICAVPRPQTLKKILLPSAMMGVRRLHLVRANRTEKSYLQSPMMAPENQLPHLIEGLSQGKRIALPTVTLHPLFRPFVEDTWPSIQSESESLVSADKQVLLLPDMESARSAKKISELAEAERVVIAIGPEGGWIDYELEHWSRLGFASITLGPWVLRVEHALTASLAQVSMLTTKS